MALGFRGFSLADLPLSIVVLGVVITLASGTITGMRVHRWLFYRSRWARRLPADTGAWAGLLLAGLLLLDPLQFLHTIFQGPELGDDRRHAIIECLLRDDPTISLPGELPSLCP